MKSTAPKAPEVKEVEQRIKELNRQRVIAEMIHRDEGRVRELDAALDDAQSELACAKLTTSTTYRSFKDRALYERPEGRTAESEASASELEAAYMRLASRARQTIEDQRRERMRQAELLVLDAKYREQMRQERKERARYRAKMRRARRRKEEKKRIHAIITAARRIKKGKAA